MTFIAHGFRISVVSDVRERVRDIGSPLRFILRRTSLVECVNVYTEREHIYKKIKTKPSVAIFSKHVLFSQTSNDE
jgi:hypothetical protein